MIIFDMVLTGNQFTAVGGQWQALGAGIFKVLQGFYVGSRRVQGSARVLHGF